MICLSCKKQIPDDSTRCPECGAEVFHKEQVKKEIHLRRRQRWFFYALLILLFLGMVVAIIKVYTENSDLLLKMASSQRNYDSQTDELQSVRDDLDAKAAQLSKIQKELDQQKEKLTGSLTSTEAELARKISELSSSASEKMSAIARLERINSAFLNIADSAAGISDEDLRRIPVANVWPLSTDTDKDGLPDDAEKSLGTSATSSDTDSDGYEDGAELTGGFNPLGEGSMPIDKSFADKQKGKIFRQAWGGGYLWYVGQDGKRYFLSPIEELAQKIVVTPTETQTSTSTATSTADMASPATSIIPTVSSTTSVAPVMDVVDPAKVSAPVVPSNVNSGAPIIDPMDLGGTSPAPKQVVIE